MYFSIIFKTLFMYFFIILVYRIMGKKELGQLSIVDLIVSILIAELIAVGIESKNSIFISIIPIIVLMIVQISVSYLTIKSDKIRNVIEGKPIVIIKNGKINFSSMKKLRYSLDDLLTQLRLQGVKSIDKVNYAVTKADLNLDNKKKIITLELQIDNNICPVLDYFKIFMDRTMMSKYAAKYLKIWYELIINGTKLL